LTSLLIASPAPNSLVSAADPPALQLDSINPALDGQIESVAYFAVLPYPEIRQVGAVSSPPFSVIPTNLQPGVLSFFAVATNRDGAVRTSATIVLRVRPVNDDFSDAALLEGYSWQTMGYTAQATRENGEPGEGGASVWWKWTAPSIGTVSIDTDGSGFDTVLAVLGQVQSGQLKAIAVTGKGRFPIVPDVPAAAESGVVPGYDVTTWYGFFGPRGMPPEIVAKLNKVLNESIKEPAVAERLIKAGVTVQGSTPEAFGKFMADELARWTKVREAAGIPQQ